MSPHRLQARDLLIHLDRSPGRRVGRQLEGQLREAIRSGTLSAGTDLPSTRALAEDLGVSRGVVGRAYAQLAGEGYVLIRQGANPRVCKLPQLKRAPASPAESATRPKVHYDLRSHLPDVTTFPRHAWLRSTRNALAAATSADLSYLDPAGLHALRIEVANYLGRARGVVADPELIVITAGATHAVSLIGRVLADRGSTSMAFENPSHLVLHAVAERAGQTPVGVPVDACGLVVEMLGEQTSALVSPAHQFPTGVVLSAGRRADLICWASTGNRLVIEDDYDAEFRYDRAPIGALQGLSPEHVAYIGSTGKTLAPAIRLGWAVLPPDLVEPIAAELGSTMLHVSGIDQLAFTDFLRQGEFDRHLRRMRAIYRRRRDVLVAALEAHLPDLRVSGIAAGLHVVLELPSSKMEASVRAHARSAGVLVQSLSQHTLPGYDCPAALLIGYGSVPEPTLEMAVEQLAVAIRAAAGASEDDRR
jgi:GntR family transcriptional regulator/MocR family aminotransferase